MRNIKNNYSSGTWFVDGPFESESDLFIRVFDKEKGEVFDLCNLGCDETGNFINNAALISSAPDLAEALIDMVDYVGNISNTSVEKAISALKKAGIKI